METFKNKLLLIAIVFFIPIVHGNAQVVDIPDTNFRNGLMKTVDTNHDGLIQVQEAEVVENLSPKCSFDVYLDLKGLEAFKNLKVFQTSCNFKTVYDFGQNKLLEELTINYSGLTELKLGDNPNLLSVIVVQAYELETIDIRNSPDLARLIVLEAPNLSKVYVYNKEQALKMRKIGLYSSEIPSSVYEAPNVLGIEKEEVSYSQIIQKGTEIELEKGVILDTKGNMVMTIAQAGSFSIDHFPSGLYFFKTVQGRSFKLVLAE